jgi:hypothetical protein
MNIENAKPNDVVGADVQYACLDCGACREVRIMKGKPRPKSGVCRECDGETEAVGIWDVCAAEVR